MLWNGSNWRYRLSPYSNSSGLSGNMQFMIFTITFILDCYLKGQIYDIFSHFQDLLLKFVKCLTARIPLTWPDRKDSDLHTSAFLLTCAHGTLVPHSGRHSPCALLPFSLTSAQLIPVPRHIFNLPCAHLISSTDICAEEPHPTPWVASSLRTSPSRQLTTNMLFLYNIGIQ